MSSLSWLDFSDAERRRALQIVELLGRPETRDELGLGSIRDAFAEAMFPGVSTIQRRAAYFLLVSWTFRDVERRYGGRDKALEHTRQRELQLIEALLAADDTDGVIGARVRKELRQVPSMIYWSGLERWGIRRKAGSREQWSRSVARSEELALDDDGQVVGTPESWWHAGLPEPPPGWPESASLELRPDDAEYLRERIRERCPGTLLAILAERREPWPTSDIPFVWDLAIPELDPETKALVAHARRFSELMHGAALLYNHALAVATADEAREAEYQAEVLRWAEREAGADRVSVPLEATKDLLRKLGARHTDPTWRFVEDWHTLNEDAAAVLRDRRFIDLVRARELAVKKRQARLSFDAARETWRGAAGISQLEYRWSSAQRQLLDIIRVGAA